MPLPSRDLKKPTFYKTESIFNSVASSITPKRLDISKFYVMKMGEKMRKNLPERTLLIAR